MTLQASPISELTPETALRGLLAEWLGRYFDGGSHAVGTGPAAVFPLVALAFGQSPANQPMGSNPVALPQLRTVVFETGTADVPVRDLLQLGPGSVLKLNRRKGDPVDIYLRGVKFATGNLVVVGDQLGVRIKEVLSPSRPPA